MRLCGFSYELYHSIDSSILAGRHRYFVNQSLYNILPSGKGQGIEMRSHTRTHVRNKRR